MLTKKSIITCAVLFVIGFTTNVLLQSSSTSQFKNELIQSCIDIDQKNLAILFLGISNKQQDQKLQDSETSVLSHCMKLNIAYNGSEIFRKLLNEDMNRSDLLAKEIINNHEANDPKRLEAIELEKHQKEAANAINRNLDDIEASKKSFMGRMDRVINYFGDLISGISIPR